MHIYKCVTPVGTMYWKSESTDWVRARLSDRFDPEVKWSGSIDIYPISTKLAKSIQIIGDFCERFQDSLLYTLFQEAENGTVLLALIPDVKGCIHANI